MLQNSQKNVNAQQHQPPDNAQFHKYTVQDTDRESFDKVCAIQFVIQAGLIDVMGITSILSGTSLLLVILLMLAQGAYLIIDADRFQKSAK